MVICQKAEHLQIGSRKWSAYMNDYDVDCDICERDASRQECEADGKYHSHGMVHGYDKAENKLYALCDKDYKTHQTTWKQKTEARLPRMVESADGKSIDVYI